jgi:hypothetical protein
MAAAREALVSPEWLPELTSVFPEYFEVSVTFAARVSFSLFAAQALAGNTRESNSLPASET